MCVMMMLVNYSMFQDELFLLYSYHNRMSATYVQCITLHSFVQGERERWQLCRCGFPWGKDPLLSCKCLCCKQMLVVLKSYCNALWELEEYK